MRRRTARSLMVMGIMVLCAFPATFGPGVLAADDAKPQNLIGYREFRTNLPGGRQVNAATHRAFVVRADGTERREISPELAQRPDSWTAFSAWSLDGRYALVAAGWEDPVNGVWEEKTRGFRFDPKYWLYDQCIYDTVAGTVTNLTAVDRVSFYNTAWFWPGDPSKIGLSAMLAKDTSKAQIYTMNLDGTGKAPLPGGVQSTYGLATSPDGKLITYMVDYKLYIANVDRSNAVMVKTKMNFNFIPTFSPDGEWILFLGGSANVSCHPFIVRKDGTDLRKLADRGKYRGVMQWLDVPDYHDGSSDVPVWSVDGQWVYYTSLIGTSVELMRVSMDGKVEQLTQSDPKVYYYHPTPSPDGKWLLFGSTKNGRRNLYVSKLDGTGAYPITDVPEGYGAMWGQWQPRPASAAK